MQHVMFQRRPPIRLAASAVSKILNRQSGHRNVSRRTVPEGSVGTSRISPSEPTTLSEDGIRTLRIRKHGHRPLPIPKIMDPVYLQARDKHKQPRQVIVGYRRLDLGHGRLQDIEEEDGPRREAPDVRNLKPVQDSETMTPFQIKLYTNPYARALATSIRQCNLTRARLPSHFLLQFGLFMPQVESPSSQQSDNVKPYWKLLAYPQRSPMKLPLGRILATRSTVEALASKHRNGGKWGILASPKAKERWAVMTQRAGSSGILPGKEFDWDPNMSEVVLQRLREEVVTKMRYGLECGLVKKRRYGEENEEVLAVLRLKGGVGEVHDLGESSSMAGEMGTSNGSIAGWTKYNMTKLFEGDELKVKEFMDNDLDVEKDELVVSNDRTNMGLLLALDQLQNYVGN